MTPINIFISDSSDPYFNLATEEWLFNTTDPEAIILFLWRNDPSVVIGRSQNPWVECRVEKIKEDRVNLVRRQSGGGAVYHDLGNSIFTFISPLKTYDKHVNNAIVLAALQQCGISAEASGRNDLVVMHEGMSKKFSGSGFKETKDRALHHGTVLLHTDLEKLQHYLSPQPGKLVAKGITSVSSRVLNLKTLNSSINHDILCMALVAEFCRHYGVPAQPEILNQAVLASIPSLNESYQRLKSWDWIYGKTMEFSHQMDTRFSWGGVDVCLRVDEAIIQEAVVYSDSLHPDLMFALSKALLGAHYESQAVYHALMALPLEQSEPLAHKEEFAAWLSAQIKSSR